MLVTFDSCRDSGLVKESKSLFMVGIRVIPQQMQGYKQEHFLCRLHLVRHCAGICPWAPGYGGCE
jgi:hypothetical protein